MIGGSQGGRGALIALGGLLACLLVAPASASAGDLAISLGFSKGLEYMRATGVGITTQATRQAACDGAAEATGGGGSVSGPPATSTLNESYPRSAAPDGWIVEGSATSAQTLHIFAICAGADTNVVTVDENVPAGSSSTQAAFCQGDDSATGGGIEAATAGVRIEATYPPELQTDNWFTSAKNTTGGTIDVDSHAVCTDAYIVKYRNSDVVRVKPGETGKAAAACKRREAVLGGGFVGFSGGLPASGGWASVSRPFDSKRDRKKVPDDGWRASYHNDAVVNHRLLVFAVCKAGNAPD